MTDPDPDSNSLELITQNQRAIYGYIYSLVFSHAIADEVLQETNVILCRKISEFEGRASFLTWACKIAYLETLSARRRYSRDKLTPVDDSILEQLSAQALERASTASDRLAMLRQCMDELPPHQLEMLDQRYCPDGSVAQLAKTLGRAAASVSVTLSRIRSRLHKCVENKRNLQEGTQ